PLYGVVRRLWLGDGFAAWIGQRRQACLDLLTTILEERREDDSRPELLDGAVDREARPVVGDLEQHPAGLAEVDRVEGVAVDDRRRAHLGLAERLEPLRVLGHRRAPGDVVHAARALATRLGRRGVVGDR